MRIHTTGRFVALAAGLIATDVEANCLRELTLPGTVAARSTVQRSFTLTRPGAGINVMTDSEKDELFMRVKRPSGAEACKTRGPDSILGCAPTIKRKSGEGVFTIYITNKMRRSVSYAVSCVNPP
jgi:hypothetical protein